MTRCFHPRFSRRSGFTLVEVLVTASLFSIVMSVLLAGVFSGTRAWDRADRHLERRARVRTALEQFRQDVVTAQMGSAESAGLGADVSGRPVFQTIVLNTDPGSPWAGALTQVDWSLQEGEIGLTWTRTSQALIGEELAGSPITDTLLEEIESLEIELRQGEVWVAQIDPEAPPADLIRLNLRMKDRNAHQLVLSLRPGETSQFHSDGGDGGEGGDGSDGADGGGEEMPVEMPGEGEL